jgi:hypothetical protein
MSAASSLGFLGHSSDEINANTCRKHLTPEKQDGGLQTGSSVLSCSRIQGFEISTAIPGYLWSLKLNEINASILFQRKML